MTPDNLKGIRERNEERKERYAEAAKYSFVSSTQGPTGGYRCPECQSSSQNGRPVDEPDSFRCASCKTVFKADDCSSDVDALLVEIEEDDRLIDDLAMLVRRLIRKCTSEQLKSQASDFLVRKGLQGSILRHAATNQAGEE